MSLVAFALLEKDGEDVRPAPLTERKRRLKLLLQPLREGIELGEHLEGDGAEIYKASLEKASTKVPKASQEHSACHAFFHARASQV